MTDAIDEVRHLNLAVLLLVARAATGADPAVRDAGLLDSAVHRPRTTLFGADAYPSIFDKTAALVDSLVRNHGLVDGNKRTAWLAGATFLEMNGWVLDAPDGPAYELIIAIAEGRTELDQIAAALASWSCPA